jgi:branched-chain amino acid transport system substrate-binding protein
MNNKVRGLVTANGAKIVGEEYYPMDHLDYGRTVENIMSTGADAVFNTIVPPGVVPFFQLLHDAGFQKRGGQLICTYFDENLLSLCRRNT